VISLRLEQAISSMFPRWALERAEHKLRLDMLGRAYDAAKPSRQTKGWNVSGASSRLEEGRAVRPIRNYTRDLVRNNPWAKKAANQIPAHMVGTGVMPRASSGAEVTRRRAMNAWTEWAAATDVEGLSGFGAQQHLIARTIVESGEALLLWVPTPSAPGGWVTHVLEPDYLDETYFGVTETGNRIYGGIELDERGVRIAYHLYEHHPGDWVPIVAQYRKRVRVPAAFVDHIFHRVRPGQLRGIPWFAASILGLRDLGDYMEAERWRKKIAAALAAFVKTPLAPAQSSLGQVTSQTAADGTTQGIERIAPGTIKRLRPGEEVTFSQPPADAGVDSYMRWELFAICAGLGLPYAELTGDLSNANYSSMRLGKIEFWTLLDTWQQHMIQPLLLSRAWTRVQATAGVPGMGCEWSFPKRTWIDPAKEIDAEIRAIRAGLMSQPDAIAARGDDWRQILMEQKQWKDAADAQGLIFDTDPAHVALNGVRTDAATPAETPAN
jgi:lambda family phage portal protein